MADSCWDIYKEAKLVGTQLESLGRLDAAQQIDTAMYGATSGEVLGDLSVAFTALEETEESLPTELIEKIQALSKRIREID